MDALGMAKLDAGGGLLVPGLIALVALGFVAVIAAMAARYRKFAPNEVGIFYGRKYLSADGTTRGFRLVAGGGSMLWPVVEHLQVMNTAAFQTVIDETAIPNKDNVKINVRGVATCKIAGAPEDLNNAAMSFLGKRDDQIEEFVCNILMGHLRSIIGKLGIDEILRQRDAFNRMVVEESAEELRRLGIQVITLVIQDVSDAHGYIDALGKQAVAEAIRDADIKVAQAQAQTQKMISEANREAAVVTADNDVQTAEAQRDRDVKKAQFKVAADSELARANQALAIATAEQEKMLRTREAERDAAAAEAQINVQTQLAARVEQELIANVVKQAEAECRRMVIGAEAAKQKTVIDAQAFQQAAMLHADADKAVTVRRAEAERDAATLSGEGEAARNKAILLAAAEGDAAKVRQSLLARAEGEAALKGQVLEAEAEGTRKLAAALAELTDSARLILVLDRLPQLLDVGGDAAAKVATAIFSSVAAPLGQIDELRIIDVGGSGRGLDQMSTIVPNTVFKVLAGFKAQGIDIQGLLGKLGISADEVMRLVGASAAMPAPAPAPMVLAKPEPTA